MLYGMDESALDNILVRQKDKLFGFLNSGKIESTIASLIVLHELWSVCGYTYKTREILRAAHDICIGDVNLCGLAARIAELDSTLPD